MDLQTLYLPVSDRSTTSIGILRVGLISHSDLMSLLASSPKLTSIFRRETIIETTILREWICNVAARDALASVAHLICEIAFRLEVVGMIAENSFHFPLTQQDIASASGLSTVRVNRTLQEMRKRGLISLERRTLTLLNSGN